MKFYIFFFKSDEQGTANASNLQEAPTLCAPIINVYRTWDTVCPPHLLLCYLHKVRHEQTADLRVTILLAVRKMADRYSRGLVLVCPFAAKTNSRWCRLVIKKNDAVWILTMMFATTVFLCGLTSIHYLCQHYPTCAAVYLSYLRAWKRRKVRSYRAVYLFSFSTGTKLEMGF